MVMTINDTVPGPPLIVYEGQRVIIRLHNHLLSDTVTIHWHGLHQRGTPWMDGVGYVTQCPIGAGEIYVYNFTVSNRLGYTIPFVCFTERNLLVHSHMGAQRTNGLYGAFVIKERPKPSASEPPEERIMTVGDWTHDRSEEVYKKMMSTNYYNSSKSPDNAIIGSVPWDSALINGRGRYYDKKTGLWSKAPLEKFEVEQNKKYRFRVINVGTMYQLRVSVDDHKLSVMATDGFDIKPWDRDHELENANAADVPPEYIDDSMEHFLNFGFPESDGQSPGAVNGKKFKFPAVDPLIQWSPNCARKECGPSKTCYCQHELILPYNKTVQIVMTNVGNGAGYSHPIHMHGHQFYVMKVGYANQNKTTGIVSNYYLQNNTDIYCSTAQCNDPAWANSTWRHGHVPDMNKYPPRKDTLMIPTGGYAVVRIRANNPGWWFMHCHIEMHLLAGMALMINEAPNELLKITRPTDLPKCENLVKLTWNITAASTTQATPLTEPSRGGNGDDWKDATIIVAVIAGVVLIILIVFIVYTCCCRRTKGKESQSHEMR
ncbi:uncharacterized protein [Clytia hemisphaerica]|uniref:uncharacterized protein n=1 Tax=Clytia hemisphaerica TaxID=252671 RepID=UPI0034D5515B